MEAKREEGLLWLDVEGFLFLQTLAASFCVPASLCVASVFFQLDIANATVYRSTIPSKIRNRYQSLPSLSSSSSSSPPSVSYKSPEESDTPPPLGLSEASRAAETTAWANTLAPIFRVYGVTERGHSICANVHSFFPYFYCRVPSAIERQVLSQPDIRRRMKDKKPFFEEGITNAVTAQLQAFLDVRPPSLQEILTSRKPTS